MPYAIFSNLHWNGPASMCVVDEGYAETDLSPNMSKSMAEVRTEADGGNPAMHVTKVRGWGCETEGAGDIEAMTIRKRVRVLVDMDIAAQPSVFEIAQGVLNAKATQYNVPGTMGAKINSAGSGGVDLAALGQAVLDALMATEIPANIVKVNSITVAGSGTAVDPWKPA